MVDLSELTGDPAVKEAIEAAHAAQIALVNDPTIAQGDPVTFTLIFGLYAFASAGGDCEILRHTLDGVGLMPSVGRG